MKKCIICDDEFDEESEQKKIAGGKINECPDCAKENTVKYVGLPSSDGKQAQAIILRFKSNSDREKYMKFWQNNSGLHKGKSCQLGSHLLSLAKKTTALVAVDELAIGDCRSLIYFFFKSLFFFYYKTVSNEIYIK